MFTRKERLYEKLIEFRYNELIGYIICAVGITCLIVGITELGLSFLIIGLAINVHYSLKKAAFQKILKEILEEMKIEKTTDA